MTRRRWAVVMLATMVVVSTTAASAQVPSSSSTTPGRPRPTGFGPEPVSGDCRDAGGRLCINTPRTGRLTTSPKTLREGDTLSVTVTLLPGGVSYSLQDFSLPNGQKGKCRDKTEVRTTEVQKDGVWVLDDVPVPIEGKCAFKPGPTGGGWATISAGITGPCGSQIAVQERKAEYASCAGTYASDYYGVYAKDAAILKGKVTFASGAGPGAPNIPIVVTGATGVQYLGTRADGSYDAELEPGSYTVRPLGAQEDGDGTDSSSDTDEAFTPKSQKVTLTEGKDTQADFVMEGVELSGFVRDEPAEGEKVGAPVEGVAMKVYKNGKEIRSLRTNSKGRYASSLKDGSYTVRPEYSQRAVDRDTLAGRIRDSGFKPDERKVTIKGEKKDDVDFEISDKLIFEITLESAKKKTTTGGAQTNDFTVEDGFRKGQLLMTMHVTNVLGDPVRNHEIFFKPSQTLSPRLVVCGIDGGRLRPAAAPAIGETVDRTEFKRTTDGGGDIQLTLMPGAQKGPWRMFFRDAEDEQDEPDVMEVDLQVARAANGDPRLTRLGATLKQLFPGGVGIPAGTGVLSAGSIDERQNNLLEHLDGMRTNALLDGLDWAPVSASNGSDTAVIVFPAGLSDSELDGLLANLRGQPNAQPGIIASNATVITSADTEMLARRVSVGGPSGPQTVQTLPDELPPLPGWLEQVGAATYGRRVAGGDEQAMTYFGWPHPGGCLPGLGSRTMQVTQHSPVELLFTGADGKRFGFDEFGDIIDEVLGVSVITGADDTITYRYPDAPYTVKVVGTGSGKTTLDVRRSNGTPAQIYELDASKGESGSFALAPDSGGPEQWSYGGASVTKREGLDFTVDGVPKSIPTDPYTNVEATFTDEFDEPLRFVPIEWQAQNGSGKALTDEDGTVRLSLRGAEGTPSKLRVTVPNAPPRDIEIASKAITLRDATSTDDFVNAAFDAGAIGSGGGSDGGGGGGVSAMQIVLLVLLAGAGVWFVRRQQASRTAAAGAGAGAGSTPVVADTAADAAAPETSGDSGDEPKPPAARRSWAAPRKAAAAKKAAKKAAPRAPRARKPKE